VYERGGSVNIGSKLKTRPSTGVPKPKTVNRPGSSKTYTYAGTGNKTNLSGSSMISTSNKRSSVNNSGLNSARDRTKSPIPKENNTNIEELEA
jgi:hypothetical protein